LAKLETLFVIGVYCAREYHLGTYTVLLLKASMFILMCFSHYVEGDR